LLLLLLSISLALWLLLLLLVLSLLSHAEPSLVSNVSVPRSYINLLLLLTLKLRLHS
jgi:hypothetical protein